MPTITIRNVGPELLSALKDLAKHNQRSMEQEVRQILEHVVLDRLSACQQIEDAWSRQERSTHAQEVDAWLRESRP